MNNFIEEREHTYFVNPTISMETELRERNISYYKRNSAITPRDSIELTPLEVINIADSWLKTAHRRNWKLYDDRGLEIILPKAIWQESANGI